MSYQGISIREVLNKINAPTNGWFLPQVQRQYVWGNRYDSETYVCLLLDSLLKRYPIGGIVLWETSEKVPYREFITNYTPDNYARQVDEGRWSANKSLVYDGQQRLQTLYSVLHYQFNGRVLYFDLSFDESGAEPDENGFLFKNPNESVPEYFVRMTELAHLPANEDHLTDLEDRVLAKIDDKQLQKIIRTNLKKLWSVFVEENYKSIAYFSVKANSSKEVNEVFVRLNTGGVALTQLELLLGRVKAKYSDYEEKLWEISDEIKQKSGGSNGIKISAGSILQILHFLIKDNIRIDEARISDADIDKFEYWIREENIQPLIELFSQYFWGQFKINDLSIIPRWQAIIPLAVYLITLKSNNHKWRIKDFDEDSIKKINQYFLLSQFCDWNTQTMANLFSRKAKEYASIGQNFPLSDIQKIAKKHNRTESLQEYQLLGLRWFAAKILMPNRIYVFSGDKPHIDHIFPLKLAECKHIENYQQDIDKLWNFQPISAEVNKYKLAKHPLVFFTSSEGKKYFGEYDFLPSLDSDIWNDWREFLTYRKTAMLTELKNRYGLTIEPNN